jgi:diguanylate cyclase (GGDEF)-like protein/PAS domain S-box-containing protein
VIFLTALGDPADEEHGLLLGAADYIVKPIQPAVVLARVRNQIELKRARDILRDHNAWLDAEVNRRVADNLRLEDASRAAQIRLDHQRELILTTAGEGIYGTDAQGVLNFVNPAAAEMLAYRREDLIGRPAHSTFHHTYADGSPYPAAECPLISALAAGIPLRGQEEIFWRQDGTSLPVEYSSVPIIEDGCLLGSVVSLRDISERKRYLAQLERQSNFDDLTGLPNRNLLADRLAHAIDQPRHSAESTLAVLAIEPDRFQSVNETLGRATGDRVIIELARRLSANASAADTVARLEGDEFILVSEFARADLVRCRAKAILEAMAKAMLIDGRELTLGVSIGIAFFPKDGDHAEELIRHAVSAMHKARAEGGGRSHLYAVDMEAQALARLEMESELRHAIGNGDLVLHYQPQVSLRSGAMVGVEALVRWQHPTRGLVPPAAFIPLAEETGLIVALGEWVLREACAQNQAWQDAGLPRICVAVNLSARQFEGQDVLALIDAVLKDSGLDPACLELELTESAVMKDAEGFIRVTQRLKALSVSLSLDDFGTGFSSLSYLRRFAIDRLKIDQSFTRDIHRDPDNAAIALSVIALAHNLRMSVIAEGVESEAEKDFLRARGCDEMQGYLFSRPLPAAEFAQLLASNHQLEFAADAALPVRTLLLVDDEAHILSALKRLFRREGYNVLTAGSGDEALDLLATNPVGVIISDARMADMDGSELLGRVRSLYPHVVRLMLSGYTDLLAVTRAVNSGELYQFITKPWDDRPVRAEMLRVVVAYAVFATLWILFSDTLIGRLSDNPGTLVMLGTLKGLAFVALTSLLLYALLRRVGGTDEATAAPVGNRRLVAWVVGLALLILLAGAAAMRQVAQRHEALAAAQLHAMARLKVGQIEAWLGERRKDIEIVRHLPALIRALRRWQRDGDAASTTFAREQLVEVLRIGGHRSIAVLDAAGTVRFTAGEDYHLPEDRLDTAIKRALSGNASQFADLSVDRAGGTELSFAFVAPLPAAAGAPALLILLRANEGDFLLPLLQVLPVPSASAETLLVRRDSDSVLLLDAPRDRAGSTRPRRIPLSETGSCSCRPARGCGRRTAARGA